MEVHNLVCLEPLEPLKGARHLQLPSPLVPLITYLRLLAAAMTLSAESTAAAGRAGAAGGSHSAAAGRDQACRKWTPLQVCHPSLPV